MKYSLIILIVLFVSCIEPDAIDTQEKGFYNLDSLVTGQLFLLSDQNKSVRKTVQIDGKQELQEFKFDSVSWSEELTIIRDLDLNFARYRGAYNTLDTEDSLTYLLKEGHAIPVKSVQYKFEEGSLKKIKGVYDDRKAELIYTAYREIELYFKEGLLSKYVISGYQEMIFKDQIPFMVTGEIE